MKELVKISESGKGNPVVNARDLHAFLEVGKDFSTWLKNKINKYEFVENKDYARILFDVNGKKIPLPKNGEYSITDLQRVFRIEYALTLVCAKELSMVQNNAKGSAARKYFVDAEEKYKELKAEKELKIAEIKPITFTMSEVAQKLSLTDYYGKIGRNELFRILHFHKILNDDKMPLHKYIKSGYFVGKPIRVTEEGLKWLNQKFCVQKTSNSDNSALMTLITELQEKQKIADEKQNLMIEGVTTVVETLYFAKGGKLTDEHNRQSVEHLQKFLGKAKNQQKAIE